MIFEPVILSFFISPKEFYQFYTNLLDCIPVFYENLWKETYDINKIPKNPGENDECCICEERKNDTVLSCYVIYDYKFSIISVKNVYPPGFSKKINFALYAELI